MPDSEWVNVRSPAKLNFFLEIIGRRADGYHDLETVMACISLSDRIAFRSVPGEITGETVACRGVVAELPAWENNLVFRALERLRRESGTTAGMQVRLEKQIPSKAGLGGGSSNAAAALLAANRIWNLNWPVGQLMEMASELGSDVPFFLSQGLAICRGRGEIVEPLQGPVGVPVVVAQPPEGIATVDVFGALQIPGQYVSNVRAVDACKSGSPALIADALFNRLEEPAAEISQWPSRLRREFDKVPCLGHQMSGSGSCYFGVFASHLAAATSARVLRQRIPEAIIHEYRTTCGIAICYKER